MFRRMSLPAGSPHGRVSFDIPSLDGLRAISFFLVFLGHAGVPLIPGGFGVTVFFFLSGYLITTLLRLEANKYGRVDLKLFYMRRALRIWPPFYLVLVTATLLCASGFILGKLERPSLVAQFLHYSNFWIAFHGWQGIGLGTGVYWSLAVEEHFYLLFPALFALFLRTGLSREKQRGVCFGICAAVLAWRCILVGVLHVATDRTYVATDTRFDSILFGCALALYGNPMFDLPKRERPSMSDLGLLALGLGMLLVTFLYRDEVFRETVRYTMQGIGLIPVFVTAVRFPDWGPMKVLNLRPVKFMGTLSYSLYLVHHVVVEAFAWHWPGSSVSNGILSLAVSIAIAATIWYFIEEPCAEVRRKLSAGRKAESRAPNAVPS
jgi:peptidoglycan/LPS O-acetylase OafA/YrhL